MNINTSPNIQHHTRESGIALFIAIIFASVVLLIGVTMASFGYKQVILSSSAVASQKAYYSADSAMECALYADQQQSAFSAKNGSIDCAGNLYPFSRTASSLFYKYTINKIKNVSSDSCSNVVVYKEIASPYTTYIFSVGYYNVSQNTCSVNTHTTVRGMSISYGTN